MKKTKIILLGFLMTVPLFSQERVSNPARPLNPQAGRVLELERVWQIDDSSGEFFFQLPGSFQVDSKGFLYIPDRKELLKFSPEGKFVGNLWKEGQGPGEVPGSFNPYSFVTYRNGLYLVVPPKSRIFHFDESGKFIDDVAIAANSYQILGLSDDGYFVRPYKKTWRSGDPPGILDQEYEVLFVSLDGKTSEKIAGFASRVYWSQMTVQNEADFRWAFDPDGGSLYISCTSDYRIVKIDTAKREITAIFAREYPKVKANFPPNKDGIDFNPFKKDYENDIHRMFVCDGNLWVETSVANKGQGWLYDVFDPQGRFVDSFFLKIYGYPASGGFVFSRSNPDENAVAITKYRVLNGPKAPKRP